MSHEKLAFEGDVIGTVYAVGRNISVNVESVAWYVRPIADDDGYVRVTVVSVMPAQESVVPAWHGEKELVLHVQVHRDHGFGLQDLEFWTIAMDE